MKWNSFFSAGTSKAHAIEFEDALELRETTVRISKRAPLTMDYLIACGAVQLVHRGFPTDVPVVGRLHIQG